MSELTTAAVTACFDRVAPDRDETRLFAAHARVPPR